jgi:ABC-type uncharacterized transport system permease subunit
MMSLLVPGLLATSVLFASGVRQFNAFQNGQIRDYWAWGLACAGFLLTVALVVLGFEANGGRPTTGLMGSLLGALLLLIVIGASLHQPVNALLIGVAPLTGFFTLLASTLTPDGTLGPLNLEIAIHIVASIVAYGAVAFAGTLSFFVAWHHAKLKERPLSPWVCILPPLDAMEHLFLRTVQAAWWTLTFALITGVLYVADFWAQQLAHKTALSLLAWIGMTLALWQHYRDGGVTRTMRNIAVWAALLLCIGYLGSKAIVEFLL